MKSAPTTTKKLALGTDQIDETLAAVQEVVEEARIPTSPTTKPARASTPQAQPQSPPVVTPAASVEPAASNVATLPTERKARGPRPAPVRRYSVDLPVYIINHIIDEAHDLRTTKRKYLLRALQKGGFPLKDIDIDGPPAHD